MVGWYHAVVADYAGDKLYAYTLATGRRDTTKDVTLDADNTGAQGLWSDGTTLWVSDFEDNKLYAYTWPTAVATPPKTWLY